MSTPLSRVRWVLAALAAAGLHAACGPATPRAGGAAPYRLVPEVGVCFCQSTHRTSVFVSRAQIETLLASAPCTSRGDGAEERAKAWSDRCLKALDDAGIDFEREAVVTLARYFPSGSIKGSLEIAGPTEGVLALVVRRHEPPPPWTPDLGFMGATLAVDKARVKQIRTDDGWGNELLLSTTEPVGP